MVWASLAFPKTDLDPDERLRIWAELRERTFQDGAWVVNIDDAVLVTLQGTTIYCQRKEWAVVLGLCRDYFAHPDAPTQGIEFSNVAARMACAKILVGDVKEGVLALNDLLNKTAGPHMPRLEVRQELIWTLVELVENDPPQQLVCQIVSDTIAQFAGNKHAARSALSAKSHARLHDLLVSTYPTR